MSTAYSGTERVVSASTTQNASSVASRTRASSATMASSKVRSPSSNRARKAGSCPLSSRAAAIAAARVSPSPLKQASEILERLQASVPIMSTAMLCWLRASSCCMRRAARELATWCRLSERSRESSDSCSGRGSSRTDGTDAAGRAAAACPGGVAAAGGGAASGERQQHARGGRQQQEEVQQQGGR